MEEVIKELEGQLGEPLQEGVTPLPQFVYTQEEVEARIREISSAQRGADKRRVQVESELSTTKSELASAMSQLKTLQEEWIGKIDDPDERNKLLSHLRLQEKERQLATKEAEALKIKAEAEEIRSDAIGYIKLAAAREVAGRHEISNWQLLLGAQTPEEMENLAKALKTEKGAKTGGKPTEPTGKQSAGQRQFASGASGDGGTFDVGSKTPLEISAEVLRRAKEHK